MNGIQAAIGGKGMLLERDYWAVLKDARTGPAGVVDVVSRHFEDLAPPSLVRFRRRRREGAGGPLALQDELVVNIRMAGQCGVRVIHMNENSITLATLNGHPEAGRITFGAYRHERGDVIFHIRSRARAASQMKLAGFLFAGDPMQTNTWTGFVNRVAASVGGGVHGAIHVEKRPVPEERGDRSVDAPTFVAEGD